MIEVYKYCDGEGNNPIDTWLEALRDQRARSRILLRIRRLSFGLEGDWKPVGEGLRELRVPEVGGYRVYYRWLDVAAVLLLCGGSKKTQKRDIERAKTYWRDYCGE